MAPWIRTADGSDALDLSGVPTPDDPLFDGADATATFGTNPVTSFVDSANDAAEDIGSMTAGLPFTGSGLDGSGSGPFTDLARDTRESPEKVRLLIYALIAVGVLYLLRPALEIAAALMEA